MVISKSHIANSHGISRAWVSENSVCRIPVVQREIEIKKAKICTAQERHSPASKNHARTQSTKRIYSVCLWTYAFEISHPPRKYGTIWFTSDSLLARRWTPVANEKGSRHNKKMLPSKTDPIERWINFRPSRSHSNSFIYFYDYFRARTTKRT